MQHEFLNSGDVVVGEYTNDGKQLSPGASPDNLHQLKKQRENLQRAATNNGGSLFKAPPIKMPTGKGAKKVKAVAKKKADPEPLTPLMTAAELVTEKDGLNYEPPAVVKAIRKKHVYLHNQMGRIKLSVEDILEEPMAFALVFANEDDVIFTPNAGESLNFTDGAGEMHKVYYPNTLFSWTDGIKRIMILFKASDEEEEE